MSIRVRLCLVRVLYLLRCSYIIELYLAMSLEPLTLYNVLGVAELWIALGADPPGVLGHLKWGARCVLISAVAYRSRLHLLHRLRAQEEIDNPSASSEWQYWSSGISDDSKYADLGHPHPGVSRHPDKIHTTYSPP